MESSTACSCPHFLRAGAKPPYLTRRFVSACADCCAGVPSHLICPFSLTQLKKLINGVASELALLGLDPAVLHHLLQDKPAPVTTATGINIPTHPSPSVDTFEGSDGSDEALEADGATTTIRRAISESIPSSSSAASSFSANAPAAPLSSVASQAIHAVYELTGHGTWAC
ncbi:hypothetical protein DL93DRAFT_374614 [Clavulina sp. PMI_390]|nr:hypothetical protein DL93DRAFT_374614 [Clavulina sp. PMI_390]